ncbi:peptidase family S8 protein [Synechococcus sp. MVIR-18-1]|nr:peptidase family S8 protein [Synechococcus sp. MVIR-18-1]
MQFLFDLFDPLTGQRTHQSDHVVNNAQFLNGSFESQLSQTTNSSTNELYYAFLEESNNDSSLQSRVSSALKAANIDASPIKLFEAINGFTISISPAEAERLEAIPTIRSIEADRPLPLTPPVEVIPETNNSAAESSLLSESGSSPGWREIDRAVSLDQYYVQTNTNPSREEELRANSINAAALPIYNNGSASTGEILPYGVKAVWGGSDISTKGNAGSGTYAFVIDSGVLDTTGDLNVNKTWSKSWVSGETAFTDGNGHGTHVAGTIAALANGVGVVGVAPGAEVISLKVFNSAGGGASYSTIIDAVNYATQVINNNGLDKSKVVINMSLGGSYSAGMDAAVKNAANQGIKFSIAAGNSGSDADGYSPASAGDHANIYTVSAVDNQYQMASFSNWDDQSGGDDVDVAAPGVSVLSYYKGGQLANLNGTSMAAPHVAGLLLMGGVKEGDMVTANWAGEADPFALASNGQPPSPPTPPPAPIKPPTEGLLDDFSGGQIASFWKSISLGTVNNNFTGRNESLFFTGSGTRSATTKTIDLDQGATISFDLIYGTDFNGGEEVDSGEEVVLEYSNNGSSWTTLKSFDISSGTRSWGNNSANLSADLATDSTQLRWRQKAHSSGNWDEWAVDEIFIIPLHDEVLNVDGAASSKYGNYWNGLRDSDGSVSFAFDLTDTSKDINLRLKAFDIDFHDEVKILFNGNLIDHLDLTGNNALTSQSFTLANNDLITGSNTLQFVNKNARWAWGVDQVTLETAGAFDEVLNVDGAASSKYGNYWNGLRDSDGSVSFAFDLTDTSKDINLRLKAFDIDFHDEVKILFNGNLIDHLDLTGNNALTSQSFTLANNDLITGSNTLQFVNKNARWAWGVDQVTLETAGAFDEVLNVDGAASSKYGNYWNGLRDSDGSVSFAFDLTDTSKDINLRLKAFDIDFHDEVKILFNGNLIDHLDLTGNNALTSQSFTLANNDLITGSNTLQFVNKNARWAWGVDQVTLETAGAFDEVLNVDGAASSKYGNYWNGLRDSDGSVSFAFDLTDTSKDINLRLKAFDIDFHDEVKILFNGNLIDHLDLTGNNALTSQSFTLANNDLITGSNTLQFVNKNARWAWGVDQVTLETAGAFDEVLNVDGAASSKYGNYWNGLRDSDGSVSFAFDLTDTSKDINLRLKAFDIDFHDEVKILFNGNLIDHLDLTGNNALTSQSFTLANNDLITGSNTLQFVNKNARWAWGVDQVTLETAGAFDEVLNVDGAASSKYGNYWNGLRDSDGSVSFAFDLTDTSKDINLRLKAFDIDFHDEVKILFNGNLIDHLDLTGNNALTSQSFTLANNDLITGSNTLQFVNKNARWAWGVDQVTLTQYL